MLQILVEHIYSFVFCVITKVMDLKWFVKIFVLHNATASPGSVNGRHKARGVGTTEDVCIDPHRPVNASTLVLLIKYIQGQTHRVQRFKIQLQSCREIWDKHRGFSRVHVKRHTQFSTLQAVLQRCLQLNQCHDWTTVATPEGQIGGKIFK